MTVVTQKYIKKPLYVDVVQITAENFHEVAAWCQGEIQSDDVQGQGFSGKQYIKVRVHNPKNLRQTKAFVGDWLLYTERGYKVYTTKAFLTSFDPVNPIEQSQVTTTTTPILNIPQGDTFTNGNNVPDQEKVEPIAAEGKRVLSVAEQKSMTTEEIRDLIQSGEAVLVQDLAHP